MFTLPVMKEKNISNRMVASLIQQMSYWKSEWKTPVHHQCESIKSINEMTLR